MSRSVADGLRGQDTFARQIKAQERVIDSTIRRVDLSRLRYYSGADNRLELLDAQSQLYLAQQTLLDLRRTILSNAAALNQAIGGDLSDKESAQTKASGQEYHP